jgi:hypothetical protein
MSIKTLDAKLLTSVLTDTIDLANEEVVTFAELARRVGHRRANRPTHVATIHRWRLVGLSGIRLAAAKQGGIWVTTIQAYQRWVDAITRAASGDGSGPATASSRSGDQTNSKLDKYDL